MFRVLILLTVLFSLDSYAALDSDVFKIESLLREGDLKQAKVLLDSKKLDKKVFYKLSGRLASLNGDSKKAIGFYKKAVSLGSQSDSLKLMLSQAILKEDGAKIIDALKYLEMIKEDSIQKDLLYAQGLWQQNQKNEAVIYLSDLKSRKYVSYDLIERQKSYYLFEMSKIAQIFKNTKKYYKNENAGPEVGLYVVSLLKEKDSHIAESYFDLLLTLRPLNALFLKERGVFELEKGRTFLASMFFEKAAHLDEKYSYEAAASHLSLGNHTQAKFFNSKVSDDKKRVMQLFSVHLDSEDYESALSLKLSLEKTGLLSEDRVVYALMYTAFKVKDYSTFNRLFYKITSKAYVAKVLRLKTFVEACKKSMEPSCVFS